MGDVGAKLRSERERLGIGIDRIEAETRIRALVKPRTSVATAIAAGRVIERQHERRRAARAAFPKAWRMLEHSAAGVFL